MELREITTKDLNDFKSFTPIRRILLLDQNEWKLFKEDQGDKNLAIIENYFGQNEIFPIGLPGIFKYELGKFLATIDTFQVTLSFIDELTSNQKFKDIMNDYRIAMQNFEIFLANKSYYSAFMEFRKMLEGILWMRWISKEDDVPAEITRWDYQDKLNKINSKFGDAYSVLNNLFHYKDQTPSFNINAIYQTKDYLFEYLNIVHNLADLYEDEINLFIDSFSNKTWDRYKVLLGKLKLARKSYNLENKEITSTGSVTFGEGQIDFAELINKFNMYKMSYFKDEYERGLDQGNIGKNKREVTKISKEICLQLITKEIKSEGSLNLAFLRSIFEDIYFNACTNKDSTYMITSLISELLEKEYKLKIEMLPKKYSHLLRDDRIIYSKEKANFKALVRQKDLHKHFTSFLKKFLDLIPKLED